MKSRLAGACLSGLLAGLALPAAAEIIFLDGGQVASGDAEYAYQHPSLRSVVFVSPETRQMAILPPAPVFLAQPPLLWRSPTAMPLYPPAAIVNGIYTASRPSNRDMANYSLQRAHSYSQDLHSRDSYLSLGGGATPLVGYGYGYGYGSLGPVYPPPMAPGFNQPARPSNQSMNIYLMDRAHRFSMDAYKSKRMFHRRHFVLGFGLFVTLAWGDDAYVLPPVVPAGFSELLANRATDLSVFTYEGRPALVIFDFPTLAEQGRMFNRLVTLIERMGAPRERVLGNEELAAYIRSVGKTEATLAYGNDFLVGEMVVFFNLAEIGGIKLNREELALRQFMLDRKMMVLRNGFFQAATPRAVVLSLPQQSAGSPGSPPVSELARRTILSHEVSHGEFYTNPDYANYCRRFWRNVMTEKQRAAFRKFLASSGYDAENEEMMINEGQAYLMYTPDPRAFNAKLVGLAESEIAQLRQQFRSGYAMAAQIPGN